QDGSLIFANRARVAFDGDAVGTTSFTKYGVRILLESGGVEGEALGFNGLEVTDATPNGVVTVWKGGKVRVEAVELGLRVLTDAGRSYAENTLGRVSVPQHHEIVLAKDRKPAGTSSHGGDRRTPRGR